MGDGKDRSRIEAVLNRSKFNIGEIKGVVDSIYNGEPIPPGPGPGPSPTPEEDEMAKIATQTVNVDSILPESKTSDNFTILGKNLIRTAWNTLADAITKDDLPRAMVTLSYKVIENNSTGVEGSEYFYPSYIIKQGSKEDGGDFYASLSQVATSNVDKMEVNWITDRGYFDKGVSGVPTGLFEGLFVNAEMFTPGEGNELPFTIDVYLSGSVSAGDKLSEELYFEESDFEEYSSEDPGNY